VKKIFEKKYLIFALFFAISPISQADFCNHFLGEQEKKLEEFSKQHPPFQKHFECKELPASTEPEGKSLTAKTLHSVLEHFSMWGREKIVSASFALIEGEGSIRLGISHRKITGGKPVITAGDIKFFLEKDSDEVKEVWINSKAGGYFGYSESFNQKDTVSTLPAAIRALWENGIFPEQIKIFYFSADIYDDENLDVDPSFIKPVFEL
jgi:hypothetical protein